MKTSSRTGFRSEFNRMRRIEISEMSMDKPKEENRKILFPNNVKFGHLRNCYKFPLDVENAKVSSGRRISGNVTFFLNRNLC